MKDSDNELVKAVGTNVGIGLSKVSTLHQSLGEFRRDRSYFVNETGKNILIVRGAIKRTKRQAIQEESIRNLKAGPKPGVMSKNIQHRMTRVLQGWSTAIEYAKATGESEQEMKGRKIIMITLTLPADQAHDDREIKREGLMMYLKKMIRENRLRNYVWRAEAQKNGNIHFHILTDQWVEKSISTEYWLQRLDKLGYIDRFEQKHGHRKPPAVRIEAIRDESLTNAYISKYVAKKDETRSLEGRIWGCSNNLKAIQMPESNINNEELDEIIFDAKKQERRIQTDEYFIFIKEYIPNPKVMEIMYQNPLYEAINLFNIQQIISGQASTLDEFRKELWVRSLEQEFNQYEMSEKQREWVKQQWDNDTSSDLKEYPRRE